MRLIDANRLLEEIDRIYFEHYAKSAYKFIHDFFNAFRKRLINAPTVDVVSKSLFEQYKWERDIAVAQLNELGISFGQKIDGVYLNREEYEDILEYMGQNK